jgi:hypothetical protein
MSPRDDGGAFRAAVKGVAGSALLFALVGAVGFGPWAGFGVAVGGALATANLLFFGKLIDAFLGQKGNAAPWAILGVLKLLGLFAVAWIVLRTGLFSALSFAVGYAALPVGITVSTLFRKPPGDDPSPPNDAVAPGEGSEGPPPGEDVVNGRRR